MPSTFYSQTALSIICTLIVFAPLARGAVHPWATTLIQIGVLLAAICLVIEKLPDNRITLPRSPMNRPIAALVILVLLSTAFSPHKAFAVEGVFLLLTFVAAYYVTVASVRNRKQQRILVYVIVSTAAMLAVIGMLKRFDPTLFPWWTYPDVGSTSQTSVTGPYVNRNHLAGFLEMAIPLLLVLFITRSRTMETKFALIVLALFLITTQAFTLSRGGWTSTLAAILFLAAVLVFRNDAVHRKVVVTITVGVMVIAIIVLSSFPVVQRITTLTQQDPIDNLDGRMRIWQGTVHQIADHPWLGTGPRTFALAYPAYQVPGDISLPLFAHNDYLQFTAENGIWFIPILIYASVCFFKAEFHKLRSPSRQKSGLALGAMAGGVAILVHSLSDFNLNIPANALLFTVIVALGTSCSNSKRHHGTQINADNRR